MIDGINIVCVGLDPSTWYTTSELMGVDGFPLEVIEQTGEVLKRPRRAKYHGLTFSVSPSQVGGVRCYVDGSIHKYRNGGAHNYDGFTLTDIQSTISDLKNRFGIDPNRTELHSVEIGVNVPFESNSQVVRVIKAAIVQKDKPYTDLFPRSGVHGKLCARGEYEVKIYDKGRASSVEQPILRVEIKVKKMRFLNGYGLETLADLTSPQKVAALIGVLLDALKHTVFIDPYTKTDALSQREQLTLETYRQPERWASLDRNQRRKKREQVGKILEKCKAFDVYTDLEKRVLEEWERLVNGGFEAEKQPMFTPIFEPKEAVEKDTFSPLEYVGENVSFTLCDEHPAKPPPMMVEKRVCCSCGLDISHQRKQSRFCSEKYKGGSAKKCRNRDSNRRKNLKLKIMQAQIKNQYLRITYKKDGVSYTDTLHSSEIVVSREWLDMVVSVEVMPFYSSDEKEYFYGKDARAVLERLTRENAPETWVDGG
jgi:hypothetical protein